MHGSSQMNFQRFTQRALMTLVTRQRAQRPASPVATPPPLKHTSNTSVLNKKGLSWVFSQVLLTNASRMRADLVGLGYCWYR